VPDVVLPELLELLALVPPELVPPPEEDVLLDEELVEPPPDVLEVPVEPVPVVVPPSD
jgi:hypothetical protein